MLDFVICALTNLFRIYLTDRFVSLFFEKREIRRKNKILICFCFWIVNTVLFWQLHMVWVNVISNLIGISAIVWLYTKSIKSNVFVTCSVYFLMIACDIISTMPFIHYQDGVAHSQVFGVISFFLIFICELISEKVITIRRNKNEIYSLSLILVPMSSIVVLSLLVYSGGCNGIGLAIISAGFLIVNYLMLHLHNLLVSSISEKYENDMLRQKVDIYANQLDIIRQSEEKIRIMKHDMKHHLNELKLIANHYHIVEMQEYIDRMETYVENPNELVDSGNMEMDSVLNYMLQKAREELETVTVKILLPEKIKHYFDVNVLIGNLLENAIEAASQTQQKYMGVNITLKKGVLRIKVENSFLPNNNLELNEEGKEYLTTKKDKGQHGIGLKSVKKIVESYNGTMNISIQKEMFCVTLVLYMSCT